MSVIPEGNLRWTLKMESGAVRDLDSETKLEVDRWYHVAATYDGSILTTYIDAQLESAAQMTGNINSTNIDLEIGQMLPDEIAYNFRGEIDDISIYDQALTPDEIAALSGISSSDGKDPKDIELGVWPNPVSSTLTIDLGESPGGNDRMYIEVVDISGRKLISRVERGYNGKIEIGVNALPDGLYFVAIQSSRVRGVATFIKTK